MADLLVRPKSARRPSLRDDAETPAPRRPLAAEGAIGAVVALFVTLVPIELVSLVGWAGDGRSTASVPTVLRFGVLVLLVAHHVGVHVPGGVVALPPLGLTALAGGLIGRSASQAVRAHRVDAPRDVVPLAASTCLTYAAALAVLAGAARLPGAHPSPPVAFLAGLAFSAVAVACGAAHGFGTRDLARRYLPERARQAAAGAGVAALALVALGALVVAASLAAHRRDVAGLSELLTPGAAGTLALVVLDLVLVPNAVVYALGLMVGPGFALGRGHPVTVWAAHVGAEPALPLLAAVPGDGRLPSYLLALLAATPLAGVAGGLAVGRRLDPATSLPIAAGWGAAAGALAAVGIALALAFAGGPAGPGRLTAVGASPLTVGGWLVVELAVPAAAATLGRVWWRSRSVVRLP